VLLVTHDTSVARRAERIVTMLDGRVVDAGEPAPARERSAPVRTP
jgi:ABC-type lipoprotein export system ATPase subunit